MSNNLTGDYDLVAQFSVDVISRILAAMHCGERFPHSMSLAVDDFPTLNLGAFAVSVVDKFGKAIADAARVQQAAYAAPSAGGLIPQEVIRTADPVVNWRPDPTPPPAVDLNFGKSQPQQSSQVAGLTGTSAYVAGVAQLQLGPPVLDLTRDTNIAEVHTPVMIRYHANDGTLPLSPFMRGDIITTFTIALDQGRNGANIVVKPANIYFVPAWSANSLTADDIAAIDKALAKSLQQSFQVSSTPVPPNMRDLNFKGDLVPRVVSVMMNIISNNNPSPDSVTSIFLERGNDFALAVSADAIVPPFAVAVNAAIDPYRVQHLDTTVTIHYGLGTYTFHIYTNITVLSATVQLGDNPLLDSPGLPGTGQIVLQIPVQVRFGWKDKPFFVPDPVDFDFNIVQNFALTLNGREVNLIRLGDVAVVIPSNVPDDEKKNATSNATNLFNSAWNANQAQIQQQINQALSADGLQSFIKSLMNPKTPVSKSSIAKTVLGAPTPSSAAPHEIDPDLEYQNYQISSDGIRLTGWLSVPPWPAADVEFEKDPWSPAASPEYRALNSWIPGGIIQQYQWEFHGAGTLTDSNRFVTVNAPALLPSSHQVCLTITGQRLRNSGALEYDTVTSVQCKLTSIPLAGWKGAVDWPAANRPQIVVPKPRPGPDPGIEVLAHASPWAPAAMGGGTANLLVHFPDDSSAGNYDFLARGLAQSGRSDTVAATLCVLTPRQLSTARSSGIMYADDSAAWERLLEVHKRPATVLVDPTGKPAWRHEGEIAVADLARVLRDRLSPGGQFFPQFLDSPLQPGQLAPNFLLNDASGTRSTLRMLVGRPVALIFWRTASSPVLSTIKNLRETASQGGDLGNLLILAVNDGGDAKSLHAEALVSDFSVVPDPARQISRAYAISIWPTSMLLDANGLVQNVRFGLISPQDLRPSVASKSPASSVTWKES